MILVSFMSNIFLLLNKISELKWYGRLFSRLVLTLVLISISGYFRFIGINWDDLHHLHPDERFLTMVATSISPVDGGWKSYFDSSTSSLNPYNRGFGFFVYGTAPIFLVRYLAEWINDFGLHLTNLWSGIPFNLGSGYDQIHLVGRIVSGTCDVISGLILYFIGSLLYGRRVGILASLLYAGTVALVQQAHFFTVDSVANLFVASAILFAVRIAKFDGIYNYGLFGIVLGVAIASRINLVSLIVLIPLATFCNYTNIRAGISAKISVALICLRYALAGILTLLVFRILQPYAFEGPSVLDFAPNTQWVDNMIEIRGQMSGEVDFPPNHQWTNRKALVFPWVNMVRWGMGPALGVTAWFGLVLASLQIYRRKGEWVYHVVPVVWSILYFLWQGTQWVKPIRYFLPVYPTLILLAAWILVKLLDLDASKHINSMVFLNSKLVLFGRYIVVAGVIAGTLFYAFAFTRIYTRPVTRVSASEWIYQKVPGPFTVIIENNDETSVQPLPMPAGFIYENSGSHSLMFIPKLSGFISTVTIGHIGDVINDDGPEVLHVALSEVGYSDDVLGEATLEGDFGSNSGRSLIFDPPVYVEEGVQYALVSQAMSGGPIAISGAHLVNESSWDDGLPLRIDGYDGYGGIYVGHNLELYWNDNESKREHIIKTLDAGDYLIISSNRQYDSITRLPKRYPLTVAYYEALFSGELGYEIVAEFASHPNIGSWTMSDQHAEEPFTVYDHPKVYIFKKTDVFSITKVRDVLGRVDLSSVVWMTPKQVTNAPNTLMFEADILDAQQMGGTWSKMFDRYSLLNTNHMLGVVAWSLLLLLLGWVMFPVTFLAFGGLSDKGYAISKIVSLLIVGWLTWIFVSVRWFQFDRGTITVVIGILVILSGYISINHYKKIGNWLILNREYVLKVELLWFGLFILDLLIRRANPDLWHPVYGGEKPMDFSYFNAVTKSTYFPPYDPWFSGGYINYYYFGYVMAAIPTKLLGILPAITYNLMVPTLFAMAGVGAFCVSYNLSVNIRSKEKLRVKFSPTLAGYIGAILMVIMGNLGQPETIYKGMSRVGENNVQLLGDGYQAPAFIRGIYEVFVNNQTIPIGTGEWYWNATRIIPHGVNESGPITEFPLFTFLYGDLHAHMMALPLTLMGLAWSISVALGKGKVRSKFASVMHWCLGGIVIGSLTATNTWDYPTYMLLGCGGILWKYCDSRYRDASHKRIAHYIRDICLLIGLSFLFFLPYSVWYGSSYTKLEIWRGSTTPIASYLQVYGLFLFLVGGFLFGETRILMQKYHRGYFDNRNKSADIFFVGALLLVGTVGLGLYIFGVVVAPLVLIFVMWCFLLMIIPGQSPGKLISLGLLIVSLLLTLFVECVRLGGDIGRMNTVFKFYLQAWTLFSVVGGVALAWTIGQTRKWRYSARIVWYIPLSILLLMSISYAILAIPAKARDKMALASPPGIDGMDFLQYASYQDKGKSISLKADYDAIRWMQDNVIGSPVIVEAHAPEYRLGSRYTVYTGLPGVVGWNWHQRQQRASIPSNLVTDRVEAINSFYTDVDIDDALRFLDRYAVKYVVVGDYELAYYPLEGVDKFRRMADMGLLNVAYRNDSVFIYEYDTTLSVRAD